MTLNNPSTPRLNGNPPCRRHRQDLHQPRTLPPRGRNLLPARLSQRRRRSITRYATNQIRLAQRLDFRETSPTQIPQRTALFPPSTSFRSKCRIPHRQRMPSSTSQSTTMASRDSSCRLVAELIKAIFRTVKCGSTWLI